MADIELVILETVPNIIFVPLFNNTAIPIQTKNKKGSIYDSHIIISIIATIATAKTRIQVGNIVIFLSLILPLV